LRKFSGPMAIEMVGDRFRLLQLGERPLARGVRVGHGLQRGEGLAGDEEERLFGVEIADSLGEVRAIDVGDEAERKLALRVVL